MHYCTLVILPTYIDESFVFPDKNEEHNKTEEIDRVINDIVEELMEPYSEYLEVEEVETECWCIDYKARSEVEKKYLNEINGLNLLLEELPTELKIIKREEVIKPIYDKIQKETSEHPLYNKVDPNCKECKGKGSYTYMTNPDALWDWWVIGGRWDGWIWEDNPRELSEEFKQFEYYNNTRVVGDIPKEENFVPFAMIADGCMYYEVDKEVIFELYEKYKDRICVVVDCHS